jgi:hypothetical protein
MIRKVKYHENKTGSISVRSSAQLDHDRGFCDQSYLTNDDAIRRGTASPAFYAADNDRRTSFPPFP